MRFGDTKFCWLLAPLMLVLGCAPDTGVDEEEDTEQAATQRDGIVGGQSTTAFPAVGALTRFGGTHCTGTVIAPRKVLTAAHCVKGFTASSMKFVLGGNANSPSVTLGVASLSAHPNYNASQITNDIGIVTLSQDAPVAPAKVLTSMDASFVGQELIFVGYGVSNGNSQTGAGTKRFVRMAVQSVASKTFAYAVPGKNTCNGDSGGPAFAEIGNETFVAGVTSYGDANCTQYGVDTRVDAFADFLDLGAANDPCQGETFAGRCDGTTAVWCENQQVKNQNCASQNKACGFSQSNQYYGCVSAAEADPCQGETYAGRCDGTSVVWCENKQVKTLSCSNTCGFNTNGGYYDCQ